MFNSNSLRVPMSAVSSLSSFLLLCGWLLLTISQTVAQDPFGGNPFGNAPDPFGTNEAGMGAADSSFGNFGQPTETPLAASRAAPASSGGLPAREETDPVVRLLREDPPKTPDAMAQGLTWMVRLKRWDEVRRLLDSVVADNWPLLDQAALARAAGPSLWLRLGGVEADLTEEHLRLVETIAAAPAHLARQPAWLDGWIDKLASHHAGERRVAQLRLQDGGMAAIGRLVNRLLEGDARVPRIMLVATVVEFGADGIDALQAACLVGDPGRAARVFLALAELPGKEFMAELGAGLESKFLSTEDKAELAKVLLSKYGKLPDARSIDAYLAKQFERKLSEYQEARVLAGQGTAFVWQPTPEKQTIQAIEVPLRQRRLEAVARIATHRLNLPQAAMSDWVDCGAVVLQRAYQLHPSFGSGEIEAHLIANFDRRLTSDTEYWQQVFDRASELQMHGGAIRSLQMLARSVEANTFKPLDFLSRLLKDSRPVIRYAALEALAISDPKSSFPGAEKSLEVAIEMLQLGSGPHALVIGLQSELRQAAQQQLQVQTGARVTSANSARTALLELDSTAPIELIVVVDRVADQSLYELLQRLRRSEKGRSLPIAVMTDELYQHERIWIEETPSVLSSVLSRNVEQMQRVLDRLMATLDTAPLGVSDRNYFGSVAAEFLSRLAGDREKYAFYPISNWREDLQRLGAALSLQSQLNILSGLGAADSQRMLFELSGSSTLPAADRLQAAKAFGRSVRRFGLSLNRQDVLQIYDLYNVLGPTDTAAARSLGLVLDVVEAHAGKANWPEGL